MEIKKKTEELLQYGIESFLKSSFRRAKIFFSLALSDESNNKVARFGLMCIDAIEDGLSEAKDMFSVFVFASREQQNAIMEIFENYANAPFSSGSNQDYLYDVLSLYNVKATNLEGDLYLSKIEPDNTRGINTNKLLGKVYERMGDYSKAIDYLAQAVKMKPFDDNLRKELIDVVKKNKNDE